MGHYPFFIYESAVSMAQVNAYLPPTLHKKQRTFGNTKGALFKVENEIYIGVFTQNDYSWSCVSSVVSVSSTGSSTVSVAAAASAFAA